MKKIRKLLTLFAISLFVYSCINLGNSVTGNGNVTEEDRDVSGFDALEVENGLDVFITMGENESLRLEADENLLPHIITEVDNGKLRIFSDVNIRMAKSKKIYVNYIQLNDISISSAGDVRSLNKLITNDLRLNLSSAGNLNLELEADEVEIEISSSGNATLSGETEYLKADLSSAGDLNAYNLEAKRGNVRVSSAGDARVNVTEEAEFNTSSAGDIVYMGDPKRINVNSSSAGEVRKR
ncbi:MAG: DUF2807 domain-containing protein [Bacteroidales bacterium]|nr:DUF2807 domain-containing protein [Bacteroidales bacterium]